MPTTVHYPRFGEEKNQLPCIMQTETNQLGNVHKYNYLEVIVDDKLLFDEFVEHKYNIII